MRSTLARAAALPWGLAALFLLAAAGRALFVALYTESVPFWDQWDAEGWKLLKPWVEGQLRFTDLFSTHNEHRIFFTRVISIALFEANSGQWDNLTSALANTLVYAGVATLAYRLFIPEMSRLARSLLFATCLALAWLPYGWENTLVGFQNQFYLMNGFAIAAVAVAAYGKDSWRSIALLLAIAIASLFTMASGLLAAVAAGAVLVMRMWLGQLATRRTAIAVALLAAVAIAAFLAVPVLPQHQPLKAPNVLAWARSFGVAIGWPLHWGVWGAPLLWFPSALLLLKLIVSREVSRTGLLASGIAFWVVLQCAAIAYSRGATPDLSWRYTDTLALGLLANLTIALTFVADFRTTGRGPIAALSAPLLLMATALGLYQRYPEDLAQARNRAHLSRIQSQRVADYVRDGDARHLQAPLLHIPYPDSSLLATYLSDPTIRSLLPASVRSPLSLTTERARGAFDKHATTTGLDSCSDDQCVLGTGDWRGSVTSHSFPFITVPTYTGGGAATGLSFTTDTPAGARALPLTPGERNHVIPVTHNVVTFSAADHDENAWLVIGSPRELGLLSTLATRFQTEVRSRLGHADNRITTQLQWVALPSEQTGNTPLVLVPGQSISGELALPRKGIVVGLSVLIGNFVGQSDGEIRLVGCIESRCETLTSPLAGSADNQPLPLLFSAPIVVNDRKALRFTLQSVGATKPVALWTFSRLPGSPVIDSQHLGSDRTLQLSVGYLN